MRARSALLVCAALGCGGARSEDGADAAPQLDAGDARCTEQASPLADVRFEGATGALTLADLQAPCDSPPALLAVRVLAPWCGTCQQLVDTSPTRGRASTLVDALIANEENAEPDVASARRHFRRPGAARHVIIDPEGALLAPFAARVQLPLVLLFDARSLALRASLAGATPEALDAAIARALGEPVPVTAALIDGRFLPSTWALLQKMAFGALALPAAPTVTDDPRAVALGKALFFEPALSPAGVACGSCHQREHGLASPDPTAAQGVGAGARNVPGIGFSAYMRYQFWDGRADSLLMQAVAPFENPAEMASSRAFVVRAVAERYADAYAAVFGPLPAAAADAGLVTHDALTEAFGNVARAIVAFERALPRSPGALDAYLSGDLAALSAQQKDGLVAFVAAGCAQCHHGPVLSDGAFHDLRSATGHHDLSADAGRALGVRLLASAERFGGALASDVPRTATPAMLGAFRTPPLRDVASTPPYGHGGGYASLRHVVELHRTGGEPEASRLALGQAEHWLAPFDETQRDAIVAFLSVLVATPAP